MHATLYSHDIQVVKCEVHYPLKFCPKSRARWITLANFSRSIASIVENSRGFPKVPISVGENHALTFNFGANLLCALVSEACEPNAQ